MKNSKDLALSNLSKKIEEETGCKNKSVHQIISTHNLDLSICDTMRSKENLSQRGTKIILSETEIINKAKLVTSK